LNDQRATFEKRWPFSVKYLFDDDPYKNNDSDQNSAYDDKFHEFSFPLKQGSGWNSFPFFWNFPYFQSNIFKFACLSNLPNL
jgi:hypothetical protein